MILQQGYQWANVGTGVGTNVVTANPANLIGMLVPGTYVGTLILHDSASAAGTTATSGIGTFGLPTTTAPFFISIPARCRNGITYQATGTPIVTIFWDGL